MIVPCKTAEASLASSEGALISQHRHAPITCIARASDSFPHPQSNCWGLLPGAGRVMCDHLDVSAQPDIDISLSSAGLAACLDRPSMPSNAAPADARYTTLPLYRVRIATWNVRTLNAESKPEQLAHRLQQCEIDISTVWMISLFAGRCLYVCMHMPSERQVHCVAWAHMLLYLSLAG